MGRRGLGLSSNAGSRLCICVAQFLLLVVDSYLLGSSRSRAPGLGRVCNRNLAECNQTTRMWRPRHVQWAMLSALAAPSAVHLQTCRAHASFSEQLMEEFYVRFLAMLPQGIDNQSVEHVLSHNQNCQSADASQTEGALAPCTILCVGVTYYGS